MTLSDEALMRWDNGQGVLSVNKFVCSTGASVRMHSFSAEPTSDPSYSTNMLFQGDTCQWDRCDLFSLLPDSLVYLFWDCPIGVMFNLMMSIGAPIRTVTITGGSVKISTVSPEWSWKNITWREVE